MKGQTINTFLHRQAKGNVQAIIREQTERLQKLEANMERLINAGEKMLESCHFTVLDSVSPYEDLKQAIKSAKESDRAVPAG